MITEKKIVHLRDVAVGDGRVKLIIPIAARNEEELLTLADEFIGFDPDLLEWRVDYLDEITDIDKVVNAGLKLRTKIGNRALMATIRHHEENGVREVGEELKKALYLAIIRAGCVDMIDVEVRYPEKYIAELKQCCTENNVSLMVSYHDLVKTPDRNEIISILKKEISVGADICKVSFRAQTFGDTAKLGSVIADAGEEGINVPIVSVSAGPEGVLSRIIGDVFGSDASFVSTGKTHQIHIDDVRILREYLRKNWQKIN